MFLILVKKKEKNGFEPNIFKSLVLVPIVSLSLLIDDVDNRGSCHPSYIIA